MDVREKLVELLGEVQETGINEIPAGFGCTIEYIANEKVASHLTANGVTVQELDGCEYCNEDSDGYRKMIGAFSITNPFHGNLWNIETRHCKPRQIYFCPMCGRRLTNPPKGE